MKARVYVSLKTTLLEPQGATMIAEVVDAAKVREKIEGIAPEILSNPVIEEYRVEILE